MSFLNGVARQPPAIIKRNQSSSAVSEISGASNGHQQPLERSHSTPGPGPATASNGVSHEKPLNILISIDEQVLIEQLQLEAALRPPPTSGPVHHAVPTPTPGITTPTTLWISQHTIFKSLKRQLIKLVGPSTYTIYPITNNEIKSKPWPGKTALLIILINQRLYKDEDDYLVNAEKAIKEFINHGGLAVTYKLDDLFESTDVYAENGLRANFFKERLIARCGKPFFAAPNRGIKFEDDDADKLVPKPTPAHLITCDTDPKELLGERFIRDINSNPHAKIRFVERKEEFESFEEEETLNALNSLTNLTSKGTARLPHPRIPVILNANVLLNTAKDESPTLSETSSTGASSPIPNGKPSTELSDDSARSTSTPTALGSIPPNTPFNFDVYFENLTSNRIGHNVLYQEISPSTQVLIEPFVDIDGLVAIATQQTAGRGRGENQWISPAGCAMFSVHLNVGLSTKLGQRLGFVQHLAALALVNAVKRIPGFESLDLKLKWPNDIYYSNKIKLGGIVVNSLLRGHNVHCFIGCGLNVANSAPTTCINDIIKKELGLDQKKHLDDEVLAASATNNSSTDLSNGNVTRNNSFKPLQVEQVIALALNELDSLVKAFERRGVDYVKELYYQNWIHEQQLVRIANTKQVIIEGLDDQGYLLVRDTQSGLLMSVHPDGNRFDMLHNLLVRKTCP